MVNLEYASIPESGVAVLIGNGTSLLIDALKLKQKCACDICIIGHVPFLKSGEYFNIFYRAIRRNTVALSLALKDLTTIYKDRVIAIVCVDGQYVELIRPLKSDIESKAIILDAHV